MPHIDEGNLRLSYASDVQIRKFDTHGLSTMKAVDFIAECEGETFFIELKDPHHPDATQEQRDSFDKRLSNESLHEDLKYKYRDTFLYEWACGNINKPIHYCVIINMKTMKKAALFYQTKQLRIKVPLRGPESGEWKRPIVTNCTVFNLESWNAHWKGRTPRFHVSRIRS